MKTKQLRLSFLGILLIALILFLISLWDIFNDQQWYQTILAIYGIILLLAIVMLFIGREEISKTDDTVKIFEKTLEGKLHHFKCPSCDGIFAIKKSKANNKRSFTLTCPDCGTLGSIPAKPQTVIDRIPEQKSMKTRFKCSNCGEWVTIWAEGAPLFSHIHVFSCPYCGENKPLSSS
jgi:predicted RNA-binding Zn-ribbon protein involved in translation (DUF1610 family)